jgi:hypothetical protein
MVMYDTKKDEWKETPTGKAALEGSAIAAVGTSDGNTSVFYQPTQKVIAMYNEDEEKAALLGVSGIPTTLGLSWRGPGALRLTQPGVIDRMDLQTRTRFIQRLRETTNSHFDRSWEDIRNIVQPFSDEFGLGVRWQDRGYWAAQRDTNPSRSLEQTSASAALMVCSDSDHEKWFNWYLYADMLYQLSRYMGVA